MNYLLDWTRTDKQFNKTMSQLADIACKSVLAALRTYIIYYLSANECFLEAKTADARSCVEKWSLCVVWPNRNYNEHISKHFWGFSVVCSCYLWLLFLLCGQITAGFVALIVLVQMRHSYTFDRCVQCLRKHSKVHNPFQSIAFAYCHSKNQSPSETTCPNQPSSLFLVNNWGVPFSRATFLNSNEYLLCGRSNKLSLFYSKSS